MGKFRKLNQTGCRKFIDFLEQDLNGSVPLILLDSEGTSEQTDFTIDITRWEFESRYDLGLYLSEVLADIPDYQIENDYSFWNTMSLLFFDAICPRTKEGLREKINIQKWIMGQKYYRHLVRSPWLFVKLYGETSKFLLTTSSKSPNHLSMINDSLEQLASREMLLRNKKFVEFCSKMYFDKDKQVPKSGLRGELGGGPPRMGKVAGQLALTYDLEGMDEQQLISILPREFKRWMDWL